ncbi:hypothetical protein EDB81DRAFT_924244 [Dactylonectria macrodidyma]|uniref:Uncharacterized protein n=1 Tax=Dactylonectria macrodidyma TaxID=307937 RepID=A0A9P9JGS8_9HYPO|nr:hypothetical protein EDB81DRAFT_924244 [Dactylonectria macrodidyma]
MKLSCSYPDPSGAAKRARRRRTADYDNSLAPGAEYAHPLAQQPLPSSEGSAGEAIAASLHMHLSPPWWSSLDFLGEGLVDVDWAVLGAETNQAPDGSPPPGPRDDVQNGLYPHGARPGAPVPGSIVPLSPATAAPERCRNVTLVHQDRELMHHFTTTMVHFCILKNCLQDNLYNFILNNLGLYHQSLFDAMMAWSALHLAHTRQKSKHGAEARYQRAYTELLEDLEDTVPPSLILTTIWFLLQYQLIVAEGVSKFCELINLAANVVKSEFDRDDAASAISRVGPVGSLVLVWMSVRDNQTSYLGLGGRRLGCLKMYLHIYDLIDKASIAQDSPPLANCAPGPSLTRDSPAEMQACMRLSPRNVTVAGQINILGRRCMAVVGSSAWDSVRASLTILQDEAELDESPAAKAALAVAKGNLAAMPRVTPICYNRMLLLGGYYICLIQYNTYRLQSFDVPELFRPEECADRIIRICQRVSCEQPNSPQGIWPTHIFIAGITAKDPVYQ